MRLINFIIILGLNISNLNASIDGIDENKIYKNLRCLICQGQSVAESNTEFAQTIKLVVQDLIVEGKTENEIYTFLTEKYGEWILYKPQFNQQNLVLWILPYLIFLIGGLFIFFLVKKEGEMFKMSYVLIQYLVVFF